MVETQTAPAVKNETWQNATRGKVGVIRQDSSGEQSVELIRGGAEATITRAERELTERKYRTKPKANPFRNGKLVPIEVAEDDEELQALLKQPNTITRSEIDALLDGNLKTMESRLGKIDALPALERILDVANETGASTRRMHAIRDRITALKGPEPDREAEARAGREKFYPPELGGKPPVEGSRTASV